MRVILLDGRNCMYKHGWVGRNLRDSNGSDTGAIHGLLGSLVALKRRYEDAKFVIAWDGSDTFHSWRGKLFPAYKANRANPTEDVKALRASVMSQIEVAKKLFTSVGIPQIEVDKLEADDVIGILSEKTCARSWQTLVHTSDQDYLQLMCFGVGIITSASQPPLGISEVKKKWNCSLNDLLKLRSLLGDKSDGIPRAVNGVGPVAAARYIADGVDPSLELFSMMPRTVRLSCARLEECWPTIHLNYRLMRILRSAKDPVLDRDTSLSVSIETRRVLKILESSVSRSREDYDGMLRWFVEKDLRVAMENRREIWQLQVIQNKSKNIQ